MGILQARILEWVAMPSSRESSQPRDQTQVTGIQFSSVAHSCPTLCDPMNCSPPGSFVHGDSPGKATGVGCHALLQGIFPTQGLNPGFPHHRWILYHLSHQGSPFSLLPWNLLKIGIHTFSPYSFFFYLTFMKPLFVTECGSLFHEGSFCISILA